MYRRTSPPAPTKIRRGGGRGARWATTTSLVRRHVEQAGRGKRGAREGGKRGRRHAGDVPEGEGAHDGGRDHGGLLAYRVNEVTLTVYIPRSCTTLLSVVDRSRSVGVRGAPVPDCLRARLAFPPKLDGLGRERVRQQGVAPAPAPAPRVPRGPPFSMNIPMSCVYRVLHRCQSRARMVVSTISRRVIRSPGWSSHGR